MNFSYWYDEEHMIFITQKYTAWQTVFWITDITSKAVTLLVQLQA